MINEINAAIEYLSTLLHPSVDFIKFQSQVSATLQVRYATLWFPEDSTRASASRSIQWHAHGGGEGQDEGLLQACLDHCEEEKPFDFFSSPFTLWIDPGCVSIRLGHGPGIHLLASSPASSTLKIVYGQPQVQSSNILQPPVLTVQPSTPALGSNSGNWSSLSKETAPRYPSMFNYIHTRSLSTSSVGSSYNETRSSSASSYMSSVDDSDRCPSLVGTSTSAQDSDSELSVEDMIDSGCYKNFDIIDDEDDDVINDSETRIGDETITEDMEDMGDTTICAEESVNRTTDTATIVNYDGGNVGVLGGGIRLGGVSTSSKLRKQSTGKPSSFQQQQGFLGQYAPPLPPPNSIIGFEQSLGFPIPPQQQYVMLDGYAIPTTKRIRSRGRRSRGRGAGRAARRQAAAIQALTEAEQNLGSSLPELNHQDSAVEGCEDERIMALVRQRADQVAKDMVKRHLEQERRKAETKLHQVHYQHQQQQQQQVSYHVPLHHHQQQQQQHNNVFVPHQAPYQSIRMFQPQVQAYCY